MIGGENVHINKLTVEDFNLVRPSWEDQRVDFSGAGRRGNSDPGWTQFQSTNVYLPSFSASLEQEVFFDYQHPHSAISKGAGKAFLPYVRRNDDFAQETRFHIHYSLPTTGAGNILLQIDYIYANPLQGFVAGTKQITVPATGRAWHHEIVSLENFDITNWEESNLLYMRFARLGNNAADTYAGVMLALSADFHVPFYRFGSTAEFGDTPD
jgi:hypothetical protein